MGTTMKTAGVHKVFCVLCKDWVWPVPPLAWLSPTMQASKAQQHQEAAAALSSGDVEQIRIAALQKVKEEAAEVRSNACCTCGACNRRQT